MRLWLAFAALCAVSLATGQDRDPIMEVFSSWHPDRPMRVLDHDLEDHENEDSHDRSKRSVPVQHNSYLAPSKACQTPGYTGEFCEFPICYEVNTKVPDVPSVTGNGAFVDGAQLANCTQQHVVLVDETMNNIRIKVQSVNNVNPRFDLRAPDGSVVIADDVLVQLVDTYETLYFALAPGQYVVIPSADVLSTYCNMNMQARTSLTVVGGFNQGDAYSTERSDFPNPNTYANTPATLVLHANQNRSPGKVVAVNFVGGQNTMFRPRLVSTRYGCSYEYYFEGFQCSQGSWYVQVEGTTFYGWGFRRIIPFTCAAAPVTTAPATTSATTPAPVASCKNKGMLITNLDKSTYCYCVGLFSGSDCSTKLCLNGGTLSPANSCLCPIGYSGDHCQDVKCEDDAGFGFDAEHPTITLVIRTRQQLSDVIAQVTNATQQIVNGLSFDPDYINGYIVVLFNGNKLSSVKRYYTFADVLAALQAAQASTDMSGACTDSVFSAISSALALYPTNNSPMYVITDATPSDVTEYNTVMAQLSFWRVPLNIFFIAPSPLCAITPEDKEYRTMDKLAKNSGGMIFSMANRTNVQTLMYDHMYNTIYRAQKLLSNDLAVCSNQNSFNSITIDGTITKLVIVATGTANMNLIITSPEGLHPTPSVVYTDGTNYIWVLNGPHTGNWFFNLISLSQPNGPCNFKIFQKGYHNPGPRQVQYDLFWAFTTALSGDGELVQPLYGYDTAITAHLTNYPYTNQPEYVDAALSIYGSRQGVQTQVYASNGLWRDGCSYNFYFPPYTCQVADETLYFNFYARDQRGMSIQRSGVMTCMQFSPTPNPPSGCQNGGIINPGNTTCYCPPGWTGQFCQNIQCFNGGTPAGNKCNCPMGWADQFCTAPKCITKGPDPEIMRDYVNMVFFVEITQQGISQIATLNKVFADLLRDIQSQDTHWIHNFVLVGYNSTWGDVIATAPASNPTAVVSALDTLASSLPTDPGCLVQLYQALDRAVYRGAVVAGSYIQIFQMSPADESQRGGWTTAYHFSRSLNLVVNGFLGYSPRNTNGFYCNATQSQFQLLFDLSGGSTGVVYPTQPGHISDIVRVIPAQYSSGIVYSQYQQDCTGNMQVYFPVDAYTQTIQLNVQGVNNQVTLVDSNGKVNAPIDILHDTYSNWDVYEYRKPCDDNWQESGQYCVYPGIMSKSFVEAQAFCSASGGYLVDDLNDAKNAYLLAFGANWKFWLGLANTGNGYKWDRGTASPVDLNQPQQFWKGGGPAPAYDPNNACVFFDGSVKDGNAWTLGSCGTAMPFMCQKHRYDQNYAPTRIGDDDIPPGKWYVNVTSTNSGVNQGCAVEIRVQSSLQITTGFSTSMTNDIRGTDPTQDSSNNMLMTYVHSADNELRTPILTHAMIWDVYNGTFYNAAAYQYRFECSYPWITQNFACPAENIEIGLSHIGEDAFGNMFQRVTYGHCMPPVLTCGNGGIRSNGMCICDEYWTGLYCTLPICVNNGTLDSSEKFCHCPDGYAGNSCQYDKCSAVVPYSAVPDQKTFVLVVEATLQNMVAYQQLTDNLASIVSAATSQHPNWFSHYALVLFNSTDITFAYYQATSPQVLQVLLGLQKQFITDPGSCTTNIFNSLQTVLRQRDQIVSPNSQIMLVTASGAADYHMRKETEEQLTYSEAILHWMYMTSATCGSIPTDPSVPHLVYLSYSTDGNALFLNSSSLAKFMTAYLPTRYQSSVLNNPTLSTNLTCADGSWYVQVDRSTTQIYITETAQYGSVGALSPTGQMIQPAVLYNVDETKMYSIDTSGTPGIYKISLSSPGACFASIYSVGGVTVSNYFAATTAADPTGKHSDGMEKSPQAGVPTVAVFHSDVARSARLQYVVIFDLSTQSVLLRSELYHRFGCSWEYYSDPFTCNVDALMIFVHGMDEFNQEFRRQEMAFCINGSLTTNPPITPTGMMTTTKMVTMATSPTNGGVTTAGMPQTTPGVTQPPMTTQTTPVPTTSFGNLNLQFDVVFLVDVSKSATTLYDDMTKFISTLMLSYTIGLNNARVGLIPVFGDGSLGPMAVAGFTSISSQQSLNSNLKQMKTSYADFDDAGQYLNQALSTAMNPNYISTSNGYQPGVNNVLIYVTATSTFSDNPSTAAILSSGTYGVITVGYGPGITSQTALPALAGGAACSFYGTTFAQLNGQIAGIQNLIWTANTNGGKYCGN